MSPAAQFLVALSCYAAAGAVVLARRRPADTLGAVLSVIGSANGIAVALSSLLGAIPAPVVLSLPWQVPGGAIVLEVDALSAAFLLVVFTVSALGNVHGLAYWSRSEQPRTATRVRIFYATMTLGIAVVFTARNSLLFLLAWEMMALSAFFLVATDDTREETRRAAWMYLVATHIGTLCLFAAFSLLRLETGSFLWAGGLRPDAPVSIVFLLALLGFAFKAGLVPLHFWLPAAHANAPSHVSALMSGVMLKAGIYGILRITSLVSAPPLWWSYVVGLLAAVTCVTGIALALTQTDLKRALAYSSVENMGIVCLGIALALAGRSTGEPLLVALGLGGAIAHAWNHGAFKSLLFFASGGVLHGARHRSMERMGGLLKRMPATGSAFLVGALSASGLPLLNGFIGEWLIALGFFYAIRSQAVAGWLLAFAAPALALAGAMAIASFLRIVGVAFLGSPRSAEAASAHESPRLMLLPLALLSAVCLSVGLLPAILARPLAAVTAAWSGAPAAGLLPYLRLLYPAFAIAASLIAAAAAMLALLSRRQPRAAVTWDCGYAEPTARMQYTASSTGEWFWRRLPMDRRHPGGMAVSPASSRPAGLFPDTAAFSTETADPFSSRWYEPFAATWTARFERLRWLQQGRLTIYLVYILVTTIIGVAWAALRGYWR